MRRKQVYLSLIMTIAYSLLPIGALNNLYREYIGRKIREFKTVPLFTLRI
jgi:hypothetical protein